MNAMAMVIGDDDLTESEDEEDVLMNPLSQHNYRLRTGSASTSWNNDRSSSPNSVVAQERRRRLEHMRLQHEDSGRSLCSEASLSGVSVQSDGASNSDNGSLSESLNDSLASWFHGGKKLILGMTGSSSHHHHPGGSSNSRIGGSSISDCYQRQQELEDGSQYSLGSNSSSKNSSSTMIIGPMISKGDTSSIATATTLDDCSLTRIDHSADYEAPKHSLASDLSAKEHVVSLQSKHRPEGERRRTMRRSSTCHKDEEDEGHETIPRLSASSKDRFTHHRSVSGRMEGSSSQQQRGPLARTCSGEMGPVGRREVRRSLRRTLSGEAPRRRSSRRQPTESVASSPQEERLPRLDRSTSSRDPTSSRRLRESSRSTQESHKPLSSSSSSQLVASAASRHRKLPTDVPPKRARRRSGLSKSSDVSQIRQTQRAALPPRTRSESRNSSVRTSPSEPGASADHGRRRRRRRRPTTTASAPPEDDGPVPAMTPMGGQPPSHPRSRHRPRRTASERRHTLSANNQQGLLLSIPVL